jgi:hypothetical protein
VRHDYEAGHPVVWLRNDSGEVLPPFRIVSRKNALGGINEYWNCGEPQYLNLLAFDNDAQRGPIQCQGCGEPLAVAAHIEAGKVAGAKTMTAAEARALFKRDPDDLGIALINDDGSYRYRADWDKPKFSRGD